MRLAGAEYAEIATAVGYASASGAYHGVRAYRHKAYKEVLVQEKVINLGRLNRLLLAVWPLAVQGDLPHVDRALNLIQEISKIMGLYPPQRVDMRLSALIGQVSREEGLDERAVVEAIVSHLPELGDGV